MKLSRANLRALKARTLSWQELIGFLLLFIGVATSLYPAGFNNNNTSDASWTYISFIAVPCLLLSVYLLNEITRPLFLRLNTKSECCWWLSVLAIGFLSRCLPFLMPFPEGLVHEEHESAFAARAILQYGHSGSTSFWCTNRFIALFFALFGIAESTLRLYSVTIGCLSVVLFATTVRILFRPLTAWFCAMSFSAASCLVATSWFSDEGFSLLIFTQAGLLFSFVAFLYNRHLLWFVALGFFTSIALYEYAPIKPGILLAAISIGISLFCVLKKQAIRQHVVGTLLLFCSLMIFARPMIYSIYSGGEAFFDGGRKTMIGEKSIDVYRKKIDTFYPSMLAHFRMFFIESSDWMPLKKNQPMVDSVSTAVFCISLCVFTLIAIRRVVFRSGNQRSVYLLSRASLWLGWILLAVAFCAFWKADLKAQRLQPLIPLTFLFIGEALHFLELRYPRWRPLPWMASVACCMILTNFYFQGKTLHSMEFRRSFNNKSQELCRHLGASVSHQPVVMYTDWLEGRAYFGDQNVDNWVQNTSANGYDTWSCQRRFEIALAPSPSKFVQTIGKLKQQPTAVVFGAKFVNNSDFAKHSSSEDLYPRLTDYIREADIAVDSTHCKFFTSSPWYAYAICQI